MRGWRIVASAAWIVALSPLAVGIAGWTDGGTFWVGDEWSAVVAESLRIAASAAMVSVGAAIVGRRANNIFGWLFLGGGLLQGLAHFFRVFSDGIQIGTGFAYVAPEQFVRGLALSATTSQGLIGVVLLLFFPTGRLPSPRWRPAAALALTVSAAASARYAVGPDLLAHSSGAFRVGPFRWLEYRFYAFGGVLEIQMVLIALAIAIGAASVASRFAVETRERKQQIKWVAFGATVLALATTTKVGVIGLSEARFGYCCAYTSYPRAAEALAMVILALATAAAIFRFRLWDIDLIIRRSVVICLLSVSITVLYLGIAVGIGSLTSPRTGSVVPFAATVTTAAALRPLKDRTERLADRLVYGRRAAPYEVLTQLSRRLSAGVDMATLMPAMTEAVARASDATWARLRVSPDGGRARELEWGVRTGNQATSGRSITLPVLRGDERVGELSVAKSERFSRHDRRVVEAIASQTGAALAGVALTAELQEKIDELNELAADLRASRSRLAASQRGAQEAIHREIRERIDPPLVVLEAAADAALLDGGHVDASQIERARAAWRDAVENVRRLARGVVPPVLVDKGVVPALEQEIRSNGWDVFVSVDEPSRPARLDRTVESAVFACCTAIAQHVAKPLFMAFSPRPDGAMEWSIAGRTDGLDPADLMEGVDLVHLTDRIESVGGRLRVQYDVRTGAVLEGWVPKDMEV